MSCKADSCSIGMAESVDGRSWRKPQLGMCSFHKEQHLPTWCVHVAPCSSRRAPRTLQIPYNTTASNPLLKRTIDWRNGYPGHHLSFSQIDSVRFFPAPALAPACAVPQECGSSLQAHEQSLTLPRGRRQQHQPCHLARRLRLQRCGHHG